MEAHRHLRIKLNEFVTARYGADVNEKLALRLTKLAKDKEKELKKDWINMVADAAADQLGEDKEVLLAELGFSYIARILDMESVYSPHLHTLGSNFVEFVNNIDYIHSFIGHKAKSDLHLPSLRCEDGLGGSMELVYVAPKCCHSTELVRGMVKAISNLLFQAPITCQLRSKTTVKLSADKSNYSETVFDLNLQAVQQTLDPEEIPMMLAHTNKNNERKISQSNVDNVNESIAKILETEGPEGHPLRRAARKKARQRWKKLAGVTRGAAFFRFLASQFQPVIPKEVTISPRDFCCVLPYHIMINTEGIILHAGLMIQRQVPALKNFGSALCEALSSVYPADVDLSYENISRLKNVTFILSGEYYKKDRRSCFKGHFLKLNEPRRLMFVGSPHVRNVEECITAGLKISQICEYDVTREFIFTGGWDASREEQEYQMKQKLSCYRRYGDGGGGLAGGAGLPGSVVAYNQPMPTLSEDTSDPQKLKEQLKNTRAQLEALKAKYKQLYLTMVPTSVLGNLRDKAKLGLVPRDVPREVELSPIDDGYVPDVKMSDKARQAAAAGAGFAGGKVSNGFGNDQLKSSQPAINFTDPAGKTGNGSRAKADLEKGLGGRNSSGIPGVSGLNNSGDRANSKGNRSGLVVQQPEAVRSISVDRGRHMIIEQEKAGKRAPPYQPNYVEYDGVCMMFCDVVQFTQQNNMEKALKDLNQAYRWLARLCQVFNLDIVESVGDAFLVISDVGGTSKNQSARNMADCALAFLSLNEQEFSSIQLRIGIHVGKIFGGVIERHQKMFIVWGDDLEFTCKMESFGLPGKIQISQQYFAYINDGSYNFEERERVSVRGRGPATYIILLSSKVWSKQDMQNVLLQSFTQ